jgi:hypothetical protein
VRSGALLRISRCVAVAVKVHDHDHDHDHVDEEAW